MTNFKPAKLERIQAEPISDLLTSFVVGNGLQEGLFARAVYRAWDKVSGIAGYTTGKYIKDNKLYVIISSSVVRSSIMPGKGRLLEKINNELESDEILVRCGTITVLEDIIMR